MSFCTIGIFITSLAHIRKNGLLKLSLLLLLILFEFRLKLKYD